MNLRAYRVLRLAVDAMMAPLGYHGSISARDDRVQAVLDALAQIDELDERPCTCSPDDNRPVPCPQKYALSECRAAASLQGCNPKLQSNPPEVAIAAAPCIGNDPSCPCQDGDLCHYKDSPDGTRAWAAPAEPQQPVAWRRWHEETGGEYGFTDDLNIVANYPGEYEPLYASPPRAAVLADRAARAAAQAEPVAWVAGNQSGSSGYWIELRYVHGDAAKFKIGDWIYASPPRAAAPVEDAVHFTAHNTVAAPAEPQQPVAWMWQNGKDWMVTKDPSYCPRKGYRRTPLFASPLRDSAWVAEAMRLADEYADEAALYQRRLDDPQSDPEMDLQQKDDTDAARSALEAWLKS